MSRVNAAGVLSAVVRAGTAGDWHAQPIADVLAAVVLSVALQIAAVTVGSIAHVLRVAPLGAGDWLVALALAAGPAIVGQTIRVRGQVA